MKKKGSILISVIAILSSLLMIGLAVGSATLATTLKTHRSYQNMVALDLAEAGINKAVWELNQGTGYAGETNNTSLGNGAFDIEITSVGAGVNQILATGYTPTKAHYKAKRKIRVKLTDRKATSKSAFFYGVQLGSLGAFIENNAYIEGNVYSGGSVKGLNGAYVKGSVFVYNSPGSNGTIDNINIMNPANTNSPYIYNAWAHNIFNTKIYGNATYACDSTSCFNNNTVKGTKLPNSSDPETILDSDWPIQDADINSWKEQANYGTTITGDYSGTRLGPAVVNGNMSVNSVTTLTGLVYVKGDLVINGGATLKLDSSYGPNSGLIVVDGQIRLGNGAIVSGSGDTKSTMMLLSTLTNNTLTDLKPAISAENGTQGAVYYAKNGVLKINNTGYALSFAGKGLYLSQNSYFKYEKGVKNPNFSSGPGGQWGITDWQVIY